VSIAGHLVCPHSISFPWRYGLSLKVANMTRSGSVGPLARIFVRLCRGLSGFSERLRRNVECNRARAIEQQAQRASDRRADCIAARTRPYQPPFMPMRWRRAGRRLP
jgi:hypothetical protein